MSVKEEYQQKLQVQLDEWGTEIDKLKVVAGKAKTGLSCTVAYVNGLPGFILTRPKWTVPWVSWIGLIKSSLPIDTPPDEIKASQVASPFMIKAVSSSRSSVPIPRETGSAPQR